MSRWLVCSCAAWLLVSTPELSPWGGACAAAQTADDTAAQAHFQVGASYYDMGDYEAALREFEMAYRLSHRSALFYNLSLCYQQLGRLTEAADALQRFLDEVDDIPNRAALTARLGNLRTRAARGDTGVGDTETGSSAETPASEPGPASASGEPSPASASAVSEPAADPAGGAATESTAGSVRGGAEGGSTASAAPSSGGGDAVNGGAIAGFSIAALGLVGAGAFGGLLLGENGALESSCGGTRSCTTSQLGDLRLFALVTDISFGVSLAGALLGTVFLFLPTGESEAATATALRVVPVASDSMAGLLFAGSF